MSWPGLNRADLVTITAGGVAGASLRWLVTRDTSSAHWLNASVTFPGRTLVVNVVGCLLLGGLTVLLARGATGNRRRLLVGAATGFCGSLTTFSTFAVESANLLRNAPPSVPGSVVVVFNPRSTVGSGAAYIAASLALGGVAFWLGRSAVKAVGDPA